MVYYFPRPTRRKIKLVIALVDKFRSLTSKPLLLFPLKSFGFESETSTNNLVPTLNSDYDHEPIDETFPPSLPDQAFLKTNIYENSPTKPSFDEACTKVEACVVVGFHSMKQVVIKCANHAESDALLHQYNIWTTCYTKFLK